MHGAKGQAVGTVEPPLEMAASEVLEVFWPQAAPLLQALEEGFTFDFSLTIHTEVRKHGTKKVR
jgi:hypothetical protein